MQLLQKLSLDVASKNDYITLFVKQNDKSSRYARLGITCHQEEVAIPNGAMVYLGAIKSSSTEPEVYKIGDADGCGTALIKIPDALITAPGKYKCDIYIVHGETKLSTLGFNLEVEESVGDVDDSIDDEEWESELRQLSQYTERLGNLESDVYQTPNGGTGLIATGLQNRVSGLEARTTSVEERLDAAEDDINDLRGEVESIDNLETRMDAAEADIDGKLDKEGGTISGDLILQNAATSPNTAEISDSYLYRQTAKGIHNVVDGSMTEISEIKGSTVRNENLIPYPYTNKDGTSPGTHEGVTVKDDNGVITANGTAGTNGSWIMISPLIKVKPNTKYFLSGCPSGGSTAGFYMQFNGRDENGEETKFDQNDTGDGVHFTTPATTTHCYGYVYIVVDKNITLTNKVFKPLLVEAETGIWTPPFSDLKHACINSIKSTGRNLIPFPYKDPSGNVYRGGRVLTQRGITFTFNTDGTITANGTCTDEIWLRLSKSIYVNKGSIYYISGSPSGGGSYKNYAVIFSARDSEDVSPNSYYAPADYGYGKVTISETSPIVSGYIYIFIKEGQALDNVVFKPMFGFARKEYEPYVEEIYQLPETLELPKYDSFNPKTGEITRATETITLDGSDDEGWQIMNGSYPYAYCVVGDYGTAVDDEAISNRYKSNPSISVSNNTQFGFRLFNSSVGSGGVRIIVRPSADYDFTSTSAWLTDLRNNPLIVSYKLVTPKKPEKISTTPIGYTVYNNGLEEVIDTNRIYGTLSTIKQKYTITQDPKHAATQEYVDNVGATKLDKVGGKITGSLVVEKGTDTVLPAVVVNNGEYTYGLVLEVETDSEGNESETFKLGRGEVDKNGDFKLEEDGAALALREDSTELADREIVIWEASTNRFVGSGYIIQEDGTLTEKT